MCSFIWIKIRKQNLVKNSPNYKRRILNLLKSRGKKINHNFLHIFGSSNVNRPIVTLNYISQISIIKSHFYKSTYTFFSSFGKDNNYSALTFAASSTHSLYKTNWALLGIKTYYKINFSYIQTFFTNTSRNQCVITTTTKLFHNLK